jgi:uncharacterized coiled-coil DUF342 family protein
MERQETVPDDTKTKIELLVKQITALNDQQETLNREASLWAKKRDVMHRRIKDLREQAKELREQRDQINNEVRELKNRRNRTQATAKTQIDQVEKLRKKLHRLQKTRPKESLNSLLEQKERLEWQLQTTSLTIQEEQPLVEKISQLETQIINHQRLSEIRQEANQLESKIRLMSTEAELLHRDLSTSACKSQELHKKMIEAGSEGDTLQQEADHLHERFLQFKGKAQDNYGEARALERELNALERASREKEEKKKALQREDRRKNLRKEALEKLKKGEKLTLSEFKLVGEEEPDQSS